MGYSCGTNIERGKDNMSEIPKANFAIIKHRGDLNTCQTADGFTVHRRDKVWVEEADGRNGRFIFCAPDDMHFIFIDPVWKKVIGRWFAMCSCGSPAVITGYKAYEQFGSPTTPAESTTPGEMLICYHYAQTGQHLPINWDEREIPK